MRHAWLIIAHNEFGILQRLISALDAPQSDFYVHIDRKVPVLPSLTVQEGRLFLLESRIDVSWGNVSQIETELLLMETACANGPYDYYHIISGTTLPLCSKDGINSYFEKARGNCVLSGFGKDDLYQEQLKIHRYNLFTKHFASSNQTLRRISQFAWKSCIVIQRICHISTNNAGTYFKAKNWLSLTEEAVQYLIMRKMDILKTYRFSFCGDEFFVPSELCTNALLRERIVNDEKYLKDDMGRSNATVFNLTDYQKLVKSGYLFARKFTA